MRAFSEVPILVALIVIHDSNTKQRQIMNVILDVMLFKNAKKQATAIIDSSLRSLHYSQLTDIYFKYSLMYCAYNLFSSSLAAGSCPGP